MKRSEMIKAIETEYRDFLDQIDLTALLDFLVSKGMLPPAYLCLEKSKHQKTGETLYAATSVIKYEWEPEDEKK